MNYRNILPLSDQQITIVLHLRDGFNKPEIAKLLDVTYETVKTQVERIYEKLGVRNLAGLLKYLNDRLGNKEPDNNEEGFKKPG